MLVTGIKIICLVGVAKVSIYIDVAIIMLFTSPAVST